MWSASPRILYGFVQTLCLCVTASFTNETQRLSRAHAQLLFARDVKVLAAISLVFLVVFSISLAFFLSKEASVVTNT